MKKTLSILFMLSLVLVICFGTVQANAQTCLAYCWEICIVGGVCDPEVPTPNGCYRGGGYGANPYDPYDLILTDCNIWCP